MWASIKGAATVVSRMGEEHPGDPVFLEGLLEATKLRTARQTLFTGRDRRSSPECGGGSQQEAGHKKGDVVFVLEEKDRRP
jgi:hypothetical protein